ncbi:MAG: SH3 domain-containing protein [Christensenellaceae bacterium]|nr:SH3 domain-containing protein [Christensenellaceae bacterium]
MKNFISLILSLAIAICLLPLAAKAWAPGGFYNSIEELPKSIQEDLKRNYDDGILETEINKFKSAYYYDKENGKKDVFVTLSNGEGTININYYLMENLYPYTTITTELPKGYSILDDFAIRGYDYEVDYNFDFDNQMTHPSLYASGIAFYNDGIFVKIKNNLKRITIDDNNKKTIYAGCLYLSNYAFKNADDEVPKTFNEFIKRIHSDDLAVVNNPNPKDRLNLRTQPDKNAPYIAKYYNGTVVQCFYEDGDWVKVQIGDNIGYMLKKYLSYETSPIVVEDAFPQLMPNFAKYSEIKLYNKNLSIYNTITADDYDDMPSLILGLFGSGKDTYYHIVFDNGEWGFIQEKYLWAGNG